MKMRESIARALCGNDGIDPDELSGVPGCDVKWQLYLEEADVALRVLRRPTAIMLKAACAAMSPAKRPTQKRVSVKAKHGIRYRAMIDAILAES